MIKPAGLVRAEMDNDPQYAAELQAELQRIMDRIEQAKTARLSRISFCPSEHLKDEVRRRFSNRGYQFKPTGYVGGVWQLSEDICW